MLDRVLRRHEQGFDRTQLRAKREDIKHQIHLHDIEIATLVASRAALVVELQDTAHQLATIAVPSVTHLQLIIGDKFVPREYPPGFEPIP